MHRIILALGLALTGSRVSIRDYNTVLEGTSPANYQELKPGHLMVSSFLLLAGCTRDLDSFLEQRLSFSKELFGQSEAAYSRQLFERSLFVHWGEGCLNLKVPGKYSITAEYNNEMVLVSPTRPRIRTAVGTLRSAPLIVTIVE